MQFPIIGCYYQFTGDPSYTVKVLRIEPNAIIVQASFGKLDVHPRAWPHVFTPVPDTSDQAIHDEIDAHLAF